MALIAAEVCKCLQENLLNCLFNQTALSKETTCNLENPWTVASHDLGESRLIAVARLARQLEVRRLFVIVGQKRSSFVWWATDSCLSPSTHGETFLLRLATSRAALFIVNWAFAVQAAFSAGVNT